MSEQAFNEAVIHEWFFKPAAMRRMAVAVIRLALAGGEFSANDLPPDLEHGGPGIAGSVFRWLKTCGVIEPVMAGPQPKFVYNAGSNPVKVYRLKGEKLARTLIERQGEERDAETFEQVEML